MSRASVDRVDEERVRRVAADNPDLLHNRLAQRFGISVGRLRKILGVAGCGELLNPQQIHHYTPRPGYAYAGRFALDRQRSKRAAIEKKLRAQENEKRGGWNPDFVPMRPPNGRGGP